MNIKEMIENRNNKVAQMEKVLDTAKAENRMPSNEETAQFQSLKNDVEELDNTIAMYDDMSKLGMRPVPSDKPELTNAEKDRKAFENYIRGYVVNESAGELKKEDNGAVIPTTIANQIITKVYDISPVLAQSTNYNVKGKLEIPYYDESKDKLTVAYQDEFVALSSHNGKFASIELTGFLAGALSKISRSLINNAQFNIVDFVVSEMADSIARFIEHELLVGTPSKVEGLSKLTNSVTTASGTAITADEVITLHDTIKDAYQNGAIWIMSSKTRTALRKLKGSDGRYLLNDDISSPFGTTLLGKPVYVSDNMPEIGAGNTAIYYGNIKGLATKFNEEINVQVLREKYADEHAVGVIGWFEFDSKVQNAQEIAKLVCKP